jgi:hypothetical protein
MNKAELDRSIGQAARSAVVARRGSGVRAARRRLDPAQGRQLPHDSDSTVLDMIARAIEETR